MYALKKLLDEQEAIFLFKSLSLLWEVTPCLGITDIDGNLIIAYPDSKESFFKKTCIPPLAKTPYTDPNGYSYSPLIINDIHIGCLIAGRNTLSADKLSAFLELINTLLLKQIKNKLELKEILRETLDTYKEINLLYNISDSISHCLDIEELSKTILQENNKIIKSEKSSLMLLDPTTGRLNIKAVLGGSLTPNVSLALGQGIAGIVAQEAKAVICNDVSQDSRFITGKHNTHTLLCVPLKTRERVLGVINIVNKLDGKIFTARDAKLISAVASHAANFIENAILHERKLNEDRLSRNLERYLSPHIVKNLLEGDQEMELGGVTKKVAILFSDIRKFSSLSEDMKPGALVNFLNEYFTHMVDIIFKYGGTVDKFVGDEIMAIFGAPISQADDEVRAVKTAIEMQRQMKTLQEHWGKKNMPGFSIGIGINSGEVIAGNIGSQKHMDYTVVGDEVNIAKRLEGQASGGKILTSRSIYEANKGFYEFNGFGEIFVKGKKNPVEVFEVVY